MYCRLITLIFSGGKNYSSRGKYYSLRIFFLHQISTFFTGQILSLVLFLSLVPVFCDKLIFTLYSTLYSVQYDFHYNIMSSWRLMYTVVPMDIQDFIKKKFQIVNIMYKFEVLSHMKLSIQNVALFLPQACNNNKLANLFGLVYTVHISSLL